MQTSIWVGETNTFSKFFTEGLSAKIQVPSLVKLNSYDV